MIKKSRKIEGVNRMDFSKLIVDNGVIAIPALWFIGYVITNTHLIKNEWIPAILTVISLAFTPWLLGGYDAPNFIQAILIAGGAVLGNQVYKQTDRIKSEPN